MTHTIIPMSGLGSRFVAAGYKDVKPLIPVHGRPIIAWVLDMVPTDKVTFICRPSHLESTPMREVLAKLCPHGQIVLAPENRTGPVGHIMHVQNILDDAEPVLVSYCDYYMHWDYAAFLKECATRGCDGAVPNYTGFHPNLIPEKNVYASSRVDANGNMLEIREKHSFEADKTQALHSPGMYWYKSGALFKKYAQKLLETPSLLINDEGYNSVMYQPMVEDGLTVWAPANVNHFCQWGTPDDLREFEFWTSQPAVTNLFHPTHQKKAA